ncbi:MAG: bifunctional phosphoglucose/phosphomannose isomerase [Patescibacteria group bacterium]
MNNPTSFLDTTVAYQIDSLNIAGFLRDFSNQIERAQVDFNKLDLPDYSKVREVVFCGMGGSGIGGEIASDLPAEWILKPITLCRDYNLPAFVSTSTLVVLVSFSGDTEEVLSCYKQAERLGAQIFIITSGGKLWDLAQDKKIPNYKFDYNSPPRDALGYLFTPLLSLMAKAGVLLEEKINLVPAITELKKLQIEVDIKIPTADNQAKKIAYSIFDHLPVVVGSSLTKGVARRLKSQFNEHSKAIASFEVLPELNHNMIEGFSHPARFNDDLFIILIKNTFDHPEVLKRLEIFTEFLKNKHIFCEAIEPRGVDFWSQKLCSVLIGDWVSYYLAMLNRVDPGPIPAISGLKNKLRGI